MNDINNDSSIDLEAKLDTKLAKIANAKHHRDKRNGDIYKRFLKRVQNPEPHKKLEPLNSARHLPAYEPLTDEELQFFADQDKHDAQPTKLPKEATAAAPNNERDNDTLDFTLDFSEPDRTTTTSHSVSTPEGELDTDKGSGSAFTVNIVEVDSGLAPAHHIDDYESQDRQAAASTEAEANSSQHTDSQSIDPQDEQALASKRKPSKLIIGVGSVLLTAAVLGYAAITYFSNATKDNPIQSTEATTPDNDHAAATTGTMAVATQQEQEAVIDTSTTADHTASSPSDAEPSSDESDENAITEQPADESQNNDVSTSEDKDLDTELDAEPVITYEEFKDESQITLYRETTD